MNIDINNSIIKIPSSIEIDVKRYTNYLEDELIYDIGVQICNEIYKITKKAIPDWSFAFQCISDIAEGCLYDTLKTEQYYYLMGHIPEIGYYDIDEIVCCVRENLGCAA